MNLSWPGLSSLSLLCLFTPNLAVAQENVSISSHSPQTVNLHYPDNPGGLEKLAKDIFKAQKESDTATAGRLLESLVLPHPRSWYAENFGEAAAANEGVAYEAASTRLPIMLGTSFLNLYQKNSTKPTAVLLGNICDENTSEEISNVLQSRITPVPLYELRFFNRNQFFRLSFFAFVEGGFRYVVPSKPRGPRETAAPDSTKKPDEGAAPGANRVRLGGNIAAAKLIHKIAPRYPQEAREQRLQGIVRFHAIIAKDGTVAQLRLEKGVCSLAQASFDAVRQWRYAPTLLNGEPVEVDTTIDVTFSIQQ